MEEITTTPSFGSSSPPEWRFGFRYNPFEHLEASADPHLEQHMVGLEQLQPAWKARQHTLVLAPPGGGKTATRLYTMRQTLREFGEWRTFPLAYALPWYHANTAAPVSHANHLAAICRAGAANLLATLSFRPELYLALGSEQQQRVRVFLSKSIQDPSLAHCLGVLQEAGSPSALVRWLDPTYRFNRQPTLQQIWELCGALRQTPSTPTGPLASPEIRFAELLHILQAVFHVESIFILVDGADAFPGSGLDPTLQAAWVAPLCTPANLQTWQQNNIFLKAFLPQAIQTALLPNPHLNITRLEWNTTLLVEMLKQRIRVASQGKYSSLDAISSPDLSGLEWQIVEHLTNLPREALTLTRLILENTEKQITAQSLEKAQAFYRAQWSHTASQ